MISTPIYNLKPQELSLPIPLSQKVRGLCFVFMLMAVLAGFSVNKALAQDTNVIVRDTVPAEVKILHSPRKAMIFAMVLPGLGQAYNHKYWKLPIVYAGFGTMIYFINYNTKFYRKVKDAFEYVSVTQKTIYPPTPVNIFPIPAPPNDWAVKYTEDQLKQGLNDSRHNLEVSYILTGVWYILTIVDAVVDAHFFDYNINDDLTLNIQPWVPALGTNTASNGISGGVNLTLRF